MNSRGIHIGFDVSQAGRRRAGCGFFAHAMAHELLRAAPANRYSFYPGFGDFYFDPLMPLVNPYRAPGSRYGPRHLTRGAASAFWRRPDLERALGGPEVVHSNNFWCPVQLAASRLVYTCYDLGFTVDPAWTTEENRAGCWEGVFRSAVAADWVVAISNATRDRYLQVFPHFPEDRIRVIFPCSRFGRDARSGRRPAALAGVAPGEFWLAVGTIEPRKNLGMLARAYARYRALGGAALPLVIAGGAGWRMEGYADELEALGVAGSVRRLGYVADDELAWLYTHCRANLFPSLYEGFGLPVLEGMQHGAATIASDASSIPEVAGDAALLVPPGDAEAWARAMLRLATDEEARRSLAAAGRARALRFDAAASARLLLDLYAEAVATPKRASACAAA